MKSQIPGKLKVTSSAFMEGESIPSRYTCDGANISPPLHIEDIPKGAQSLVLIVEDPDAPRIIWVHWVVWNIKPAPDIHEDSKPGIQGINDFGRKDYGGPCPPSGSHRYYFKVFALDRTLTLSPESRKKELELAIKDHILASGQLMGRYAKM